MAGLLRLCTAGSVDDGKSTLIGRLLYDSRGVYEDQVRSVEAASRNRGAGPIDFSLFTDGLRAEREQGITIDVAYRYFATARRKFILADTPGHEQYTRNMATGASTADLAILLVDARHGVREQTRRHARIARLLGHLELRAGRQQDGPGRLRPRRLRRRSATTSPELLGGRTRPRHPAQRAARRQRHHVERSHALVRRAARLLDTWRPSTVARDVHGGPFRFPVQLVLRPDHDFRGYAGQIASGTVRAGRPRHGLAVRRQRRASSASSPGTAISTSAFAPMSVTLVARGRSRHQPRRHARDRAPSTSAAGSRPRGLDGRAPARPGPRLPC